MALTLKFTDIPTKCNRKLKKQTHFIWSFNFQQTYESNLNQERKVFLMYNIVTSGPIKEKKSNHMQESKLR